MAVFRVERNKGYTVMSNYHLRDRNLSLKSKGLLSQMLSLPEDWDYTLKGLSSINKESIDAIRTAVWELDAQDETDRKGCARRKSSFHGQRQISNLGSLVLRENGLPSGRQAVTPAGQVRVIMHGTVNSFRTHVHC